MPGKADKPHRIRVRTLDGKARDVKELNKLKSNQLKMPHLDIVMTGVPSEFIVCASKEAHIEQVRPKLGGAGLEEIEGDTTIPVQSHGERGGPRERGKRGSGNHQARRGNQHGGRASQRRMGSPDAPDLKKKPYGFVALPDELTTAPPVWQDGTSSEGRHSGEIRFELETLTPLLVGWERGQVGDDKTDWRVPPSLDGVGKLAPNKSVLCPLRAPWGKRPVIIPGDSLKGLLRHELGALLGAPMERVAERSYSYRPNAMYPLKPANRFLVPRLARVPKDGVEIKTLDGEHQARVPTCLELFPAALEYNKKANKFDYRFDQQGGAPYRGGQGAGQKLNSKTRVHTSLKVLRDAQTEAFDVPKPVQDGYLVTVRHLVNLDHGHFSERHPDVPNTVTGDAARDSILKAAKDEVFQPGDLIWVEWDTEKKRIVSLGWHYYYRWAYTDSVRKKGGKLERHGLFPLDNEREKGGDGAPKELSAVRRLLGYTGDNEGSAGIGENDHTQLMGRLFANAGLEVVDENDSDDDRFLKPTFLKELGMPRPSAVEHYLKQPDYPNPKDRTDRAQLMTYGDAAGYDTPGELAGRKFYLDRRDAYGSDGKGLVPGPAADSSDTNRQNERSTLALDASMPGRRFRFTLRFRDLDAGELAAILVALCPHQFQEVVEGDHPDGYCSKLGYARPLGWGTVRIEAKALLWLDTDNNEPTLEPEPDLAKWVKEHHQATSMQKGWLDVHRHKHPDAAEYPKENGQIYTYHAKLRAEHSRRRRYQK